jgi:hypothetical protein
VSLLEQEPTHYLLQPWRWRQHVSLKYQQHWLYPNGAEIQEQYLHHLLICLFKSMLYVVLKLKRHHNHPQWIFKIENYV